MTTPSPASLSASTGLRRFTGSAGHAWGKVVAITLVLFLSVYNLPRYPLTWFDEGSHVHVPKALVRLGMYADVSSEGYRYFVLTTGGVADGHAADCGWPSSCSGSVCFRRGCRLSFVCWR